MDHPLISVITVVYNASATLEATILSVLSQSESLFEYWIIDGGSNDGSIDIMKKYEHQLAGWVSERDKGIFDAMNKGIDRANGDWLYFLGADDLLTTEVLSKVSSFLRHPLAAVYGNIIYDTGHVMRSHMGWRCLLENRLHHQGTFYHKRLFDDFRYNQKYTPAADYELTLRIYLQKQPTLYVPYTIAIFAEGGASHDLSSHQINSIRSLYISSTTLNFLLNNCLDAFYSYVRTRIKITRKLRKLLKIQKRRPSLQNI